MLVVGRRLIPWVLHHVAHMGSRELFRLAVLATALAVAYGAAHLFDVSLALGAFFAGMVMSESPLSQRAAQETLPLRDAFAVLFFVSVGMLFNPATLVNSPWLVLATLAIILAGKSAAAYLIVRAFGHSNTTALTISASLAQIGEFSFILGELGVRLDLLPGEGRDLILAGAIISILLNPVIFAAVDRLARRAAATAAPDAPPAPPEPDAIEPTKLSNHTILIGYGRVGRLVAEALAAKARPFLVVEAGDQAIAGSRERKFETIVGNAATPEILAATNPAGASHLVVAIPEPFEAGQVVEQARKANPALNILARAHSDAEVEHLRSLGANTVIMGEREIARGMIEELDSLAGTGAPSAA
jgi:CPA2 family monovalent cation:H+ antiporter-2